MDGTRWWFVTYSDSGQLSVRLQALTRQGAVEEAMEILDSDFSTISDVRGSAGMRRVAARNLLLKLWDETRTA